MCAHADPCITFMVPGSSKTTAGGGVEAGVRGNFSIREQISGAGRQKRHACKNKARATAPIKKNADCDNTCFVFMELCLIGLTYNTVIFLTSHRVCMNSS